MEIVDLRELALKKVKITGNVIGKFGTFEIEQMYKNNTKDVLEVEYTFPIVETAAVVGFEINVGDKVLKGVCKETSEAKKEYTENLVKGNSSYLMEQESDNIFRISVGKIAADEEVNIKIKYIDKFDIVDNTITVLMPTLVTPRYKSKITDKLFYGKVDYTVDFNINVDRALNVNSIECKSHKFKLVEEKDFQKVEVLNYDMSKDFKLEINLKNELASNAITSKTRDGKDMVYLSFMPEIDSSYEDDAKDYLFIVDVSGSMSGNKIAETKKAVIECLKNLDEGDKFNIVPFESRFEAMSIESLEYNEENLNKAIEYVSKLEAGGGTEILDPIKFALYEKSSDKVILLFTDGQVGNEEEILKFVNENIDKSRLFPFGIDTNVNAYFIKELAKVGNGQAELIQPNEKIDDKIIRTFARIQTPLLDDIKINYGNNKVLDEIKEDKCLFNYEFFNVFAKLEELKDDIVLEGKVADKTYSWKISKEDIRKTDVDLEILFAKQEMDRIEGYIRNTWDPQKIEGYKKLVIDLSVKYNINSKYTSFITVYERDEKILDVPKHQETVLSGEFLNESVVCDMGIPMFSRSKSARSAGRGAMAGGMFKMRQSSAKIAPVDGMVTFCGGIQEDEALYMGSIYTASDKAEEYYETFKNQEEKSILTYILYAIYYLKGIINNIKFDMDAFMKFIDENRSQIEANDLYKKLLVKCYYELLESSEKDKADKFLKLLSDSSRKIILTNMKMNVDLEKISRVKFDEIVKAEKVVENIDDVLWYIIEEE